MSTRRRHRLAPLLLAGIAVLVLSGCGRASSEAVSRRPLPPCRSVTSVTQSADGAISGCIVVTPLTAGAYTVGLQSFLQFSSGPPSGALIRKLTGGRSSTLPPHPTARLTLSPASGPPGTVLTLTAHLDVALPAAQRRLAAGDLPPQFCWDGCAAGLLLGASRVHWLSSRTFRVRVSVPAAPWVEGTRGGRLLGLASGSFALAVSCLTKATCSLNLPEGTASFRLEVTHRPAWCANLHSCGALRVFPRSAHPGAVIRISGHSPLIEFDSGKNRFYGQPEIRRASARGGSQLVISRGPGSLATVTVGRAPLRVLAPLSFSSLTQAAPISEVSDGNTPIAADPRDPRIVAWCNAHSIGLSVDGARRAVSTARVKPLLTSGPYINMAGAPIGCTDVMPLSATTLIAGFGVGLKRFPPPPGYVVALETRNDGHTWTAVPAPPGTNATGFGSLRAGQAVFASAIHAPGRLSLPEYDPSRPLAQDTADGVSWHPGALSCPARGPCVTLGPLQSGDCAMGLSTQYVLSSRDGGATWRRTPIVGQLQPCGEAELYATGPRTVMLLNGLSAFVLQRSSNAGASWSEISLPVPRGLRNLDYGIGFGPGGITVLPDGGLLLSGKFSDWELLRPGARRWCTVTGVPRALQRLYQDSSLTVIGERVWWLASKPVGGPGAGLITSVQTLPVSEIRCAGG